MIHEVMFDGYRSQVIIDDADRKTGKHVGSPFINSKAAICDRLARPRARRDGPEGHHGPCDTMGKVGLIGRVKRLRGEEDFRHASLLDAREER